MNNLDYDVSESVGFLMSQPQEKLPTHFGEWNYLALNTPELSISKALRTKVEQMPVLDCEILQSYNELRLAHLQLSIISAGYVWQDGDQGVPQILPKSLAKPWYNISKRLGIQPVLSHADLVLANWKLKDPQGSLCLENLQCIYHALPGAQEAEWFIIVTAQIEIDFASSIKSIIELMKASVHIDKDTYIRCLSTIEDAMKKMKKSLSRMHDNLSTETFYNTMRPFLSGWGGPSSALPKGLIYQGISDEPKQMIGGSAAQSSSLQCIDATLGIVHNDDIKTFLKKMRDYMPTKHKQFIEDIEQTTKTRTYAQNSCDLEVKNSYNSCVQSVVDFRSYHIQLITKFIIIMSNKSNRSRDYESVAKQGTGGSSLLPFLKSIRDTTKDSLIP